VKDAADVKRHEFFDGIDWEAAANRRLKPPFVPEKTKGPLQTRNFDSCFLRMEAVDSFVDSSISFTQKKVNFKNFEFNRNALAKTKPNSKDSD